jgi:hypothetical protein
VGEGFLQRIHGDARLAALAAVPLLLTCLSMDVEARGGCDYSDEFLRGTVYRRVLGLLLHEWDAVKAQRGADPRQVELGMRLFAELAVRFGYDTALRYHDVWSEAYRCARELGVATPEVEEFIHRICDSGRLLVRDTSYGFFFGHKAFYDFFFAEGVRSRLQAEVPGGGAS